VDSSGRRVKRNLWINSRDWFEGARSERVEMISDGKFMDVIRGFVRFVIASCSSALFPSLRLSSHEV